MIVEISDMKSRKPLKNFWNNIHFHPTDAIEDDWGKAILDTVAEDKAAKCVRMYAMLEDIVSEKNGKLQYDFTLNDERLEYLLSKGFDILLSYNFIPPCIASDSAEVSNVSKSKTRYKGKYIVTSPPKDYALWEKICRVYTQHIVDRFGEDTVSRFYLQCFNEPDYKLFFMKDEKDMKVRAAEYCRLYDGFEAGVTSVSRKLCIGGPALAFSVPFLDDFLKHVAGAERKLDFICFHAYCLSPESINNGKDIDVLDKVQKIRSVADTAKKYGFGSIPLIADEWGAATGGYFNIDECPKLMFRETEVFAAYFAKMLTAYHNIDVDLEKMIICLSGQHEMNTDFSGFRNFFTLHGYRKPIYNAFVLAAKLLPYELGYSVDGKMPVYTDTECPDLTVLPSCDKNARISILICYAGRHFEKLDDIAVTIKIKGFENRTAKVWLIDGSHSNSYAKYLEMGSPDVPDKKTVGIIKEAGKLFFENVHFGDSLDLTLSANSTVLVEM